MLYVYQEWLWFYGVNLKGNNKKKTLKNIISINLKIELIKIELKILYTIAIRQMLLLLMVCLEVYSLMVDVLEIQTANVKCICKIAPKNNVKIMFVF